MIATFLWMGLLAGSERVVAQSPGVDVELLLQRLEELEQKVKTLERNDTEDKAASGTAPAQDQVWPTVSLGANGLTVTSVDSNYLFALRGFLQVDSRTFWDDGGIANNNDFLLRRARLIFSGTVLRDFDFQVSPGFGGSTARIYDAYLRYGHHPWLRARIGKFKTPVGLEALQSDQFNAFNERALPTQLVPGRSVGFQLEGEINDGALSYAAGIFNGLSDGRNSGNADFNDSKDFAGRVFAQPFKQGGADGWRGLGFGVGGSWGDFTAASAAGLPSDLGYVTDGRQQFFAYTATVLSEGAHWRVAPQAYYYVGPFHLLGEYALSAQRVRQATQTALLRHTSWQVTAGWVLTGEAATPRGVAPEHPFDLRRGSWGAFEIVGRYSVLDLDDDAFPVFANPGSATEARAWSLGLNWYLNQNLILKTSYARTTFDGGGAGVLPPAPVTRQPEQVFFTRVQLSF
ncbi:MAG TPA: porin [Verrucomicrobiota bacterium]|nr:porin [Verrucomicrobiota bacterium]HNT14716.1 porin [Verrucomicrobiota bacterium]